MPVDLKARQRSYANRLGFAEEFGGAPAKPTNSVLPAITGTATVGQTLTGTKGTWAGRPTPSILLEWLAAGVVIPGANATTYVLTPSEAGKVITLRGTARSIAGSVAKTSTATSAVAGALPVNTVPPAITGTAQVGETLTVANGTWTGTPTPTITRQWMADGVAIDGETGTTYVPVEDDVGKVITVAVTGTNLMGAASVTTAATAEVEAE
jgi:hypothetical protein